ncbi:UNVERIFIED_CONTAM: hypothetical protein Sindi_2503100 [Sesamum indicum]
MVLSTYLNIYDVVANELRDEIDATGVDQIINARWIWERAVVEAVEEEEEVVVEQEVVVVVGVVVENEEGKPITEDMVLEEVEEAEEVEETEAGMDGEGGVVVEAVGVVVVMEEEVGVGEVVEVEEEEEEEEEGVVVKVEDGDGVAEEAVVGFGDAVVILRHKASCLHDFA